MLRNISRNLDGIEYPDREREPVKYLSVRYSMSEWIVELWRKEYGMERTEQLLASFLKEVPLCIRANRSRIAPEELRELLEAEGLTVVPDQEFADVFYIEAVDYLKSLKSFEQGLFYVQDKSSMKAARAAEPKENDYVIDVCAAPGGKSILIAELMHGTGKVKACDLTEYKVSLIEDNIRRCGITNVEAVCRDATVYDETEKEKADIVVADLPCSGLGVMRRKKDIRYQMTPEKLKSLAALQREILHVVQEYVKPGGALVYSTCTIHRGENEENVEWFLKEHTGFELIYMEQLLPTEGNGDGFFIAKLRKKKNG